MVRRERTVASSEAATETTKPGAGTKSGDGHLLGLRSGRSTRDADEGEIEGLAVEGDALKLVHHLRRERDRQIDRQRERGGEKTGNDRISVNAFAVPGVRAGRGLGMYNGHGERVDMEEGKKGEREGEGERERGREREGERERERRA